MLGAGAKRVFGLGSYLRGSPGFCLSIGIQVVPTVYHDFHSRNHHKPQEIIIYLHLYQWNLVHRESGDGCRWQRYLL